MKPILFVIVMAMSLAAAEKRFVISDFGAVADAVTVNTKAIQSVIDKCAASGGGVVVVPKGTFVRELKLCAVLEAQSLPSGQNSI